MLTNPPDRPPRVATPPVPGSSADDAPGRELNLADAAERSTKRHAGIGGFAIGCVLTAAIALLVVQNTHDAEIEWLVFDGRAPTWLMLLISFLAGAVAAPMVWFGARFAMRRRRTRLRAIADTRRPRPTGRRATPG